MTIELVWESKKLLSMRYEGSVSGSELLDASLKIGGDPGFDDLRYLLSDWSTVKETNISTEDVRKLVAYVSSMARTNDKIMNASVMSKDETGQALVSFYQFLARDLPWEMQYFYNVRDARDWFSLKV